MKNIKLITICMLVLVTATWSCKEKSTTETEDYIPQNAEASSDCNLTSVEFNTWFSAGVASENGSVNAANSVDFTHENNCDFYKWSEQMFLWITSQSDGQTVMESPMFYTISPLKYIGSDTIRDFIPHAPGTILRAFSDVNKTDDIESEEGQATNDALMDRHGNLVYYITFGNDVYAQFLTGVKNGALNGDTFPTTATERDEIVNYAKQFGVELADANALAIELKTSWVLASSLENAADFVKAEAIIPTYQKTDALWVITDEETVELAMVGMHIVGSASGHPEMIWATFEHQNNAPNAKYQYIDAEGNTVDVPADGDGSWIFNSDISDTPNVSHMKFSNDSIIAVPGYKVSPSNTLMEKPWGSSYDTQPNPEDLTPAAANTTVINLNNSITNLLPGNDVRKNYQFIGATWTNNGAAPNGKPYSPTNTEDGVSIGTSQLSNSTMETYFQFGPNYNNNSQCFLCHHSSPAGLKPIDLSHVFHYINPLSGESKSAEPETP